MFYVTVPAKHLFFVKDTLYALGTISIMEAPDSVEPSHTNCTTAEVGEDGPELSVNLPESIPVTTK